MDGIDVELIFPNKGLAMWATPDPQFAMAQCQVWNTWAWEQFGNHQDRMIPAGALVDSSTFAKMKAQGLDPRGYLDNNDATAFFTATGDLLLTGPTLTNVNDVRVILVD